MWHKCRKCDKDVWSINVTDLNENRPKDVTTVHKCLNENLVFCVSYDGKNVNELNITNTKLLDIDSEIEKININDFCS